jgi:uncharacterized membrane protein
MQKMRLVFFLGIYLCFFGVACADVQSAPLLDKEEVFIAKVVVVASSSYETVPNTGVKALYQTVRVRSLNATSSKLITIEDTAFQMSEGDKVYVKHLITREGDEYYSIVESYRLDRLAILVCFFFVLVILFGGKQGFLSLVALFVSFGVIFSFLFPQILDGTNIVLVSTIVALLSLFVAMYLTHGFTRLTTSAFLGCVATVTSTVILSKVVISFAKLTGFSQEESVFLNLATNGSLNFVDLLIGGVIIGVIGVIDDVAITQASVVHELRHANPLLTKKELYKKALKVGKNHMGAVVNTLILAYTGVALPSVLLLYVSNAPVLELLNREGIATEIVRSVVGSSGLLLAVPVTTFVAIMLMRGDVYISTTKEHVPHSHHH